jgi:hypothetical protein
MMNTNMKEVARHINGSTAASSKDPLKIAVTGLN